TYLGGDERGEGKNGIQLAKKTSLEKGSTINVSGKEKGGRAIVWGDIALIDGNINAQGKDIAKTGGFVETSGHDLFIKDNTIVDAKEWLLDPENVSINNGVNNASELTSDNNSNKVLKNSLTTVSNGTLSNALAKGIEVNISATKMITVTADVDVKNGTLTLHTEQNGIKVNGNITSTLNGNLTIKSGSWVDIHKNISLGAQGNINITAKQDIAFEKGSNQTITGQGTITSGNQKGFRFSNVSLNGTGTGLLFNINRPGSDNGNITNYFNGTLNISGIVNISMVAPNTHTWYNRHKGRTYWNLSHLNVSKDSNFTLAIDSRGEKGGGAGPLQSYYKLNGISFTGDTTFNVSRGAKVNFDIKTAIGGINGHDNLNYASFDGNISVLGGGVVNFNFDSSTSNLQTPGVIIKSEYFNVSGGSTLNFATQGSTKTGFSIEKDLTLNATKSNITLLQVEGTDGMIGKGIVAKKNITFEGGNITFGSKKAITEIKGNVTINRNTNVTLLSSNYDQHKSPLNITGNVTNKGNLTATGSVINIARNLTVETNAKFLANPNFSFNVSGLFNNKGNSNISIARGGAHFKDINNTKSLNITTNSDSTYRTIIEGNITNSNGDLNITDNKNNAEIQIGGDISQKQGNLTISSDKINITKQITIKKGVNEEDSGSGTTSNANLTIKTKELKLAQDLNISGFNKAEITAKEGADLIIGNSDNNNNANAKKVTFDKVKESKISADGHNVTLNSKVETSNDDNSTGDDGDNNTGLAINAKNVTVNNNITSHKAVNITASEKVATKEGTTINATTGSVEVTAKTGDIKGGIESKSGNVNITASGDMLKVSNVTGQNVTVTASSGAVTTTEGSTINATANVVEISAREGELRGEIKAEEGAVNITAKEKNLTVSNVTAKNNVTVKAEKGTLTTTSGKTIKSKDDKVELTTKSGGIGGTISGDTVSIKATNDLTTQAGSTINGTNGVTTSSQSGDIGGTISGGKVEVSATKDLTTKSGSEIKATAGEVNVTSATGTIGGTISGNTVNVTANTGDLTVGDGTRINAMQGAATLTASSGKLTTKASSSITSANNQVNLSAKDGNIEGNINAANVTLNTTGALTTMKGSSINANSGTLVINAKDAKLDGAALGNHTVVNVTNASGSGSVIATTSSRVNITGDLITVNGLNIISKNGINTVLLKGVKIDVKYIQPGIASVDEVIEAKRILEKVKDLSDEEREALAKLGVSAVRFAEPNNAITINTQNEFTTRPSSQVTISEGKVCFLIGNGATICTNIADIER
ncbi:beta strand repeat-containing protein, partial [Haemophilus influenzae]|uniref:beta strand repeat-containing protein n=2 Tax=Haemophilus influenzae TaxID=727 RepID=UPI000E57B8B5